MPEKYIGGYSLADAQSWANTIATAINSGAYSSQKAGWLTGMTLSDTTTSAMTWASDANTYVCTNALKGGVAALETGDLGGSYYTGNTAVIQLLIAKAGYRLAAWLNLIHTGATSLKVKREADAEPVIYDQFAADEYSTARLARRAWMAMHPDSCH